MIGQDIIAWNCLGTKSGEFLREIRDLIRAHRMMIIVLLEPKISDAETDVICRKLGKSRWTRSEATGFRRGSLDVLGRGGGLGQACICTQVFLARESHVDWRFDLGDDRHLHKPNCTHQEAHLGLDLMVITRPWMNIGDFNCVLKGGGARRLVNLAAISSWMNERV